MSFTKFSIDADISLTEFAIELSLQGTVLILPWSGISGLVPFCSVSSLGLLSGDG